MASSIFFGVALVRKMLLKTWNCSKNFLGNFIFTTYAFKSCSNVEMPYDLLWNLCCSILYFRAKLWKCVMFKLVWRFVQPDNYFHNFSNFVSTTDSNCKRCDCSWKKTYYWTEEDEKKKTKEETHIFRLVNRNYI